MDKKGRRGTKCKITAKQACEIKKLLEVGVSQQKVGILFDIDQTTVSRIKLNKTKLFKR
jgi:DNA invertase Pin-like site-specific DNA recombinase